MWRTTRTPCPSRVWIHRASGPAPAPVARADAVLRARAAAAATTNDDDSNAIVGESYLLSNTDMCGSPANARPFARYLHRARLTGLVPGAYYRYAVDGGNDGGDGGASSQPPAIFGFRAAPKPSPRAAVSLAMVGDVGWTHHRRSKSPGADAVLRAIAADVDEARAEAVVVVGDVAYADGDVDVWDGFMASIGGEGGAESKTAAARAAGAPEADRIADAAPPVRYGAVAARVPFLVNVGNHEYSYEEGWDHTDPSGGRPYSPSWRNWGNDSGGECGSMVARRFWMPRSGGGGGGGRGGSVGGVSNTTTTSNRLVAQDEGGGGEEHPLDFELFSPPPSARRQRGATSNSSGSGSANNNGAAPAPVRPLPPFWYAFDYGSVHVTVVSSEHDLSPGSRQAQWLEADLGSVDRCLTPWLVLAIHRPLLVVLPHKSNRYVADHLRSFLDPMLRAYRVDAVVSGHVHAFYRSCVVSSAPSASGGDVSEEEGGSVGRCVHGGRGGADSGALSRADARAAAAGREEEGEEEQDGGDDDHGTVHLVVGSGGHKLSGASGAQPRWVRALFDRAYGYLRLQANGAETLLVEFVSPASEGDEEQEEEEDQGEASSSSSSSTPPRRVLDRAVYHGGLHHEAACRESTARRVEQHQRQWQGQWQGQQAVY
jgi:hypothetical protein